MNAAGQSTNIPADGLIDLLPQAVARGAFYSLCSESDALAACARLVPELAQPQHQPLRLTQARYGSVARAYIEASEDKVVGIDWQRAMQAALPCDPALTLPCDHSPFYSTPELLAKALVSLA